MGHRTEQNKFKTREEAEKDQAWRGVPGYSECYPRGITEETQPDGTVIHVSHTETYYG
jgi:hypothetical protein